MSVERRKKGVRPLLIADGQGVLRTYSELITLLQAHLCGEGLEPNRVVVGDAWKPALNFRDERIKDVACLVAALEQVHIPTTSKRRVISNLMSLCDHLTVLHWPEGEDALRIQLTKIADRLKHTTASKRVPAATRRKLKPAKDLPPPMPRRSA